MARSLLYRFLRNRDKEDVIKKRRHQNGWRVTLALLALAPFLLVATDV